MINEHFIIFYLVWYWFMCIMYKNNFLPNKIDALGQKLNSELIQDLGECKFCMNFWSSSVFAVCLGLYMGDYNYLMWGIYSASIAAHFK